RSRCSSRAITDSSSIAQVLQDEDIKWKAKELEQLENLDKIKEKRSLSSRVEKIGFDCEQAS
ncbi:unnamed protein product, partial [Musa banksii]